MTVPNEPRRAAVYRLYDETGALLYIGSSYDPAKRCEAHRRKPWWPRVVQRTEEWHPNRGVAYRLETEAISTEGPKFNRMGMPVYGAECSRRQQAMADQQRVKCKVAAEALKVRKRTASKWRAAGYCSDRATAEGMLAERAYKEASGAFPNGVEYPSLRAIQMRLARAAE